MLIERALAGSPEAITELVRTHSGQIYRVSLKILKNHVDAEDNLQDVLCKVCANIYRFEGRSRFSTWLFRIATNEALMRIRRRRSERWTIEADLSGAEGQESPAFDIEDKGPDQERQYIAKELTAKAFHGLPTSLIDMFVRHKTEGWTQRELANETGLSLAALKSRMYAARGRLQERLQALC
jgi:RNA polymerase sigma-70 factor (ECF subfamily)